MVLYTLIFKFLEMRWEDKRQFIYEQNFVTVIPKYLNFDTFLKDLFAINKL
jgi:hypothetical protein